LVAVAKGSFYGGTGLIYGSTNAGTTWTSWTLPLLSNNWSSVASSADGTKLVAASYFEFGGDGLIYASSNSGAAWAATHAPVNDWTSVASSADGTKLVAVTDARYEGTNGLVMGGVYRSADSGATWTRTSAPGNEWVSVASSADGTKLAAMADAYYDGTNELTTGGIYISRDSGATWTQTSAPNIPWFSVVCSADGTTLVAAAAGFSQIYVSKDGGEAWTTGSPAAAWTAVVSSADGYRVVATTTDGAVYTLPYLGPWRMADANPNEWNSVAYSADGTKAVAVSSYSYYSGGEGLIYTSTNSGATWRPTTAPSNAWSCVASSSKGTKLVAAASADASGNYGRGRIYFSGNAGATWAPAAAPLNAWSSLAASADGTKWVAASSVNSSGQSSSGRIYMSANSGATWQQTTLPPNAWSSVTSSSDGTKSVAASYYSGDGRIADGSMYTSTNSGATWTQTAWSDNWSCVASSADGATLVAATSWNGGGLIYVSGDGGTTWALASAPTNALSSLACSADGTKLVAAADGAVYVSTNSGAAWALSDAPAGPWQAVASSADGGNILAVASGGPIATLQAPPDLPLPPQPMLSIGMPGAGLGLAWLVPSTSFVLQQSSDLSSTNWQDVTNHPTLNFNNLHSEVRLTPPSANTFYRLKQKQP
jgi:hypothetical protein